MAAPKTTIVDFSSYYDALSAGTYINTLEHMKMIMPGSGAITVSPNLYPEAFQLVTGGKNGGNCLRMHYPKGQVGRDPRWWTIDCGYPGQPLHLEFDFMFEDMADLTGNGGKIGPAGINWGSQSQGIRQFVWWGGTVGTNIKPFSLILQQGDGKQFIQPNFYTPQNIQFGRWYHWHYELLGGPGGHAKFWLDGEELHPTVTGFGNTTIGDRCFIDMAFWAGGGEGSGPPTEFWARNDNVRVYTGSTPVPPDPGPGPATYRLEGTFTGTITPLEP